MAESAGRITGMIEVNDTYALLVLLEPEYNLSDSAFAIGDKVKVVSE